MLDTLLQFKFQAAATCAKISIQAHNMEIRVYLQGKYYKIYRPTERPECIDEFVISYEKYFKATFKAPLELFPFFFEYK